MPSERGNLLRALGETRDVFTIQKYLDMTLNQVCLGKVSDICTWEKCKIPGKRYGIIY